MTRHALGGRARGAGVLTQSAGYRLAAYTHARCARALDALSTLDPARKNDHSVELLDKVQVKATGCDARC